MLIRCRQSCEKLIHLEEGVEEGFGVGDWIDRVKREDKIEEGKQERSGGEITKDRDNRK